MQLFSGQNKILIFSFILLFVAGCNNPNQGENNIWTLEINGQIIHVEIADSAEEWVLGLSYRDTLQENHGMLFVFPDAHRREFWMRGCNFDIDLAYIESNRIISEIITMEKEPPDTPLDSLTLYPSQSITVKYALEMIGGWFEEHNINAGATINFN
jgi:uncharacterized membrane protein (UPF0127 family)